MNIKPSFCSKFQGDFLYFHYLDCKSNWVTISYFLGLFQWKASIAEISTERSFEGISSLTNNLTNSSTIIVSVYSIRYAKTFYNKLTYRKEDLI